MAGRVTKDSPQEVESIKRLQRFSIEVWNLTQNWITVNQKAFTVVQELINARLQLMYARDATEEDDKKQDEDSANASLSQDETARLRRDVVVGAERVGQLVENLGRIVGKFRIASERIPAWRQLCPQPGPTIGHILDVMESSLPALIEMYSRELDIRSKGLQDLAAFEHRDVFTAVALTFQYEPFVDQNLVACLYILVSSQQ